MLGVPVTSTPGRVLHWSGSSAHACSAAASGQRWRGLRQTSFPCPRQEAVCQHHSFPWQRSSSRWQIQVLQNPHFCLQARILSQATNGVTVVSLELTGSLYSFLRKRPVKYSRLNNHPVCLLFFQVKMTFLRKVASSACNSQGCPFPGDSTVLRHAEGFMWTLRSSHSVKSCVHRIEIQ